MLPVRTARTCPQAEHIVSTATTPTIWRGRYFMALTVWKETAVPPLKRSIIGVLMIPRQTALTRNQRRTTGSLPESLVKKPLELGGLRS